MLPVKVLIRCFTLALYIDDAAAATMAAENARPQVRPQFGGDFNIQKAEFNPFVWSDD